MRAFEATIPHGLLPAHARLLDGLAAAIEEKGYVATTIADIVRCASVSKRTFYEHFEDKEGCFLALYVELSQTVIATMRAAADSSAAWPDKVRAVVNAYLQALGARPALTRAIFLELNAAGERALTTRREVHGKFAEFLRELVARGRKDGEELRELPPAMALAIVGGVNELVLLTIESGRSARLPELAQTACALFTAVVSSR